jgi:hypothetical protein
MGIVVVVNKKMPYTSGGPRITKDSIGLLHRLPIIDGTKTQYSRSMMLTANVLSVSSKAGNSMSQRVQTSLQASPSVSMSTCETTWQYLAAGVNTAIAANIIAKNVLICAERLSICYNYRCKGNYNFLQWYFYLQFFVGRCPR